MEAVNEGTFDSHNIFCVELCTVMERKDNENAVEYGHEEDEYVLEKDEMTPAYSLFVYVNIMNNVKATIFGDDGQGDYD